MSVYMTEEEQIQAIKKWWLRYQTPILLVLSLLMLSGAGYRYWQWHHEKILTQASNVYDRLMVAFSQHQNKEVFAYSNELIQHYGDTVYGDAARMTLAKIYVMQDESKKAIPLLEAVALNSKVAVFKQVAKIRVARLMIAEKKFDVALKLLNVVDNKAYMTVVNELKGDIFVEKGEYQQAISSYKIAIKEAKKHGIGNLFLEMKTNELAALQQTNTNNQYGETKRLV